MFAYRNKVYMDEDVMRNKIDKTLKDHGVDWKLTEDGKYPKDYEILLEEIMIVLKNECK